MESSSPTDLPVVVITEQHHWLTIRQVDPQHYTVTRLHRNRESDPVTVIRILQVERQALETVLRAELGDSEFCDVTVSLIPSGQVDSSPGYHNIAVAKGILSTSITKHEIYGIAFPGKGSSGISDRIDSFYTDQSVMRKARSNLAIPVILDFVKMIDGVKYLSDTSYEPMIGVISS